MTHSTQTYKKCCCIGKKRGYKMVHTSFKQKIHTHKYAKHIETRKHKKYFNIYLGYN